MKPPFSTTQFLQFLYRFGRHFSTHGFDVRAPLPIRAEREIIFGKIDAALEVLSTYDPRRFACLLRDLPSILVTPLPASTAQCHYRTNMCVLDWDFVTSTKTTAEEVAQILVHEGAHARLNRAGFRREEAKRPRIERICLRQEVAFAHRIPDGNALVLEAEARLREDLPESFYTNQARADRALEAIRKLGWLGRLAYRNRKRSPE